MKVIDYTLNTNSSEECFSKWKKTVEGKNTSEDGNEEYVARMQNQYLFEEFNNIAKMVNLHQVGLKSDSLPNSNVN